MQRSRGWFAGILLLTLAPLGAQAPKDAPKPATKDVPAREAEVDQKVVQVLVAFGRSAESYKAPASARVAFEQVIDHYDVANAAARAGLGYKKIKDEWQQVTPADKLPADTATAEQQKTVREAWAQAKKRAAKLHRDLGLALIAEGVDNRGRFQLERSLAFEDDPEAHKALGHESIDGFYGTAEELAFVKRMREITAKAKEIAAQEFTVKELAESSMPTELKKSGLPFFGARSTNFTAWFVDSQEAAAAWVVWAERGAAMLDWLIPAGSKQRLRLRTMQWTAVVRTTEQRDAMLAASPNMTGQYTVEQARMFGGMSFKTTTGTAAYFRGEIENDADHAVAHVTMRCCIHDGNPGLGEGLVHAMTWLMCGTTYSWYCSLPHTATKDSTPPLQRSPDEFFARLHGEIEAGRDWPLRDLPRERRDNFRDSARVKSWSFMLWLIARHPDRWIKVFEQLKPEQLQIEDVHAVFQGLFEADANQLEAEWREWARPGSRLGKAAGLGH